MQEVFALKKGKENRRKVVSQHEFIGTWEQLSVHAPQFHGQMLKLIIVSEPIETQEMRDDSDAELHLRLALLVQEAESFDLEPGKLSNDLNKNVVSDMVADKYRKMGFSL